MASFDKLTIETPEQIHLEFPLAGIGSRFLAVAIDSLIQSSLLAASFIVATLVTTGSFSFWQAGWSWATAVLVIALFLIVYVYYAFFEAIWNGQTPGKRYTHLRVIKDSGRPITPYEAITRNLLRVVDQLPGIYAVGILAILLSRQNKRLGDHVAGTIVVHEKPLQEMQPGLVAAEEPLHLVYNAARLSVEEWQLIESFLQRRSYLSDDVRWRVAGQIADRVAATLGVPREKRGPSEDFLEALARERRLPRRY